MQKYRNIVLLSDLDGTLLNSDGKASDKNKEAINYFIENGGKFGICTGRGVQNASIFLEGININFYCVYCNGSLLYDFVNKKILKTVSLNCQKIRPFLDKCIKEQNYIGIQIHILEQCFFVSDIKATDKKVIENHNPCQFVKLDVIKDYEWLKILFNGTQIEKKWLVEQSEYLVKEEIVDRVHSSDLYYEFLAFHSNKGSMVHSLRNYLKSGEVLYAVGDYYNDVEMIKEADYGILTENAPNEIKQYADFICKDHNHDAIFDVIHQIIR